MFSEHNGIKLEINNRKKTMSFKDKHLKIKQYTSNNHQSKRNSQTKFQKVPELNENEHTIYQNLQYTVKAVPRGNFIVLNANNRKEKRSQINMLSSFKMLEEGRAK